MTTSTTIHSIADIIRQRAYTHGDKTALRHDAGSLSFAELDALSNRIANAMLGSGLQPGDRVGVLDRSSMFVIATVLGAAKAGMVYVGVNWRLTASELEYQIGDAEIGLLFVGPDYQEIGTALSHALPSIKTTVPLGSDLLPAQSWLQQWSTEDPGTDVPSNHPVVILYSSGTTGRPKGIELGAPGLIGLIDGGARWGFTENGVNLVNLPLFHIGGFGWSLLGLYNANTSVVVRDASPEDLLAAIEINSVTNGFLVPTIIQMLLDSPEFSTDKVRSLGTIVYGGAPMSPELLRRCLSSLPCDIAGSYGLTETTNGLTTLPPAAHSLEGKNVERLKSVGLPHSGVRLRICDPQSGDAQPTGEIGEIQVHAVQNMLGYWRRPEATQATIDGEGWLRTGDVGYLDEDGYLYICDRIADLIISGGENVYPAEVEAVLSEHPRVSQVAVVGVPDKKWGETPIAFVISASSSTAGLEEELTAHCREFLAGYKNPRGYTFVPTFPMTATGKIAKTELRAIARSD